MEVLSKLWFWMRWGVNKLLCSIKHWEWKCRRSKWNRVGDSTCLGSSKGPCHYCCKEHGVCKGSQTTHTAWEGVSSSGHIETRPLLSQLCQNICWQLHRPCSSSQHLNVLSFTHFLSLNTSVLDLTFRVLDLR